LANNSHTTNNHGYGHKNEECLGNNICMSDSLSSTKNAAESIGIRIEQLIAVDPSAF